MTLRITADINGHVIGYIDITNISKLASVSDYRYRAHRPDSPVAVNSLVFQHSRDDGWAKLVQTVLADIEENSPGFFKPKEAVR